VVIGGILPICFSLYWHADPTTLSFATTVAGRSTNTSRSDAVANSITLATQDAHARSLQHRHVAGVDIESTADGAPGRRSDIGEGQVA
jgi:hypothetical protein